MRTLTQREIVDKDFNNKFRGYNPEEVDQFLDTIIGDYEQFLNIINSLEKEKAELMAEIMSLKQELRNSRLSVEVARNNVESSEVTNIDIIKRLSQLEKMVYGTREKNIENDD